MSIEFINAFFPFLIGIAIGFSAGMGLGHKQGLDKGKNEKN